MMFVFAGPTLSAEDIAGRGDFVRLPPVAQGDLYRVARTRPKAIGVVDGFFSGAPSVWHKEILWAISEGVPVFGSASMGALRAAELHRFGMIGVGRVFEAFRDGALEDDDEVAVVHGPAELGYLAASEAMVNIRATLANAEAEGVLSAKARSALEAYAKSLFFPQRNWETLLEQAGALGLEEEEVGALRAWLDKGRVDQKRLDALAMLDAMLAPPPRPPPFKFEWTVFWDELVARSEAVAAEPRGSPSERVLDELRLEGPDPYARVEAQAMLRMRAGQGLSASAAPSPEELRAELAQLRARLGLYTRPDLDRWLAANHLDAASLERLLAGELRLAAWRRRARSALQPYLVEELRANGDYARLAERARRKAEALAERTGRVRAPPGGAVALRLWFFERRLGRMLPQDIEAAARALGFADAAALDAALLRESLFDDANG